MRLTEKNKSLIMISCSDQPRTKEFYTLFNNKYPNEERINQSTVGKIEKKNQE